MAGGIERFHAALRAGNDARYQGAVSYAELIVTGLERDSTGGLLAARGTIDGAGEDTVPMRGVSSTSVGDHLLIAYPQGDPAGPKTYIRHVASANPSPSIDVNPDLPDPQFAAVPFATALVTTATSIWSSLTIFFLAVEDRYYPEGYTVSFRLLGGEWRESGFVPHLGGAQQAMLGNDFPPGSAVDVRLRAHYARNTSVSAGLDTRTFVTATDNITPGDATGLVSKPTPGFLDLIPAGNLDAVHFDHWQYEIASTAGGAGLSFYPAPGELLLRPNVVPLSYYAAVRPISHSNVQGGRYPPTGFIGPIAVEESATVEDLVPPPDWAAPTLALAGGLDRARLTISLPAYSYPTDYDHTEARIATNGQPPLPVSIPNGATGAQQVIPVDYGTTTVVLVGFDRAGNFSNPSPPTTATIASPTGLPGTAPILTGVQQALAVLLKWSPVVGATGYEIQRAPDTSGVPGTFAPINAQIASLSYLDTLPDQTLILPVYWYRVRAVNLIGNGPFSTPAQVQMGALDGNNIRAQTITATKLVQGDTGFFNTIVGTQSILGAVIGTAAAPGTRLELRGNLTTNPNQLRMIESVAGVERLRSVISGAGYTLYDDDGAANSGWFRSPVDASALLQAHALTVQKSQGQWNAANSRFIFTATGGSAAAFQRVVQSGSDRLALGIVDALYFVSGGIAVGGALSGDWLAINQGGQIVFGSGNAIADVNLYRGATNLLKTDNIFHAAGGLIVANATVQGSNFKFRQRHGAALPLAAGSQLGFGYWEMDSSTGNAIGLRLLGQRGPAGGTNWDEGRFRLETEIDGGGARGGYLELGFRGASAFWGLGDQANGTTLFWDQAAGFIRAAANMHIDGALSKGSGTFDIPSVVPGHADTHRLRHGFFESADRGGTLLRLAVEVRDEGDAASVTDSNGDAHAATVAPVAGQGRGYRVRVALPAWWAHLNECGQVLANPVGQFAGCFGEVSDGGAAVLLTVERPGRYTAWVAATRKDAAARAGWDARGGGAVEYEVAAPEAAGTPGSAGP